MIEGMISLATLSPAGVWGGPRVLEQADTPQPLSMKATGPLSSSGPPAGDKGELGSRNYAKSWVL